VLLCLALSLLLVLPTPWNFVGFGLSLVGFSGEVAFWHRKVRWRPKVVGAQTLIGRRGTVSIACRPKGQVRVRGETWAARCVDGADPGDSVVVVGRHRLTLDVERTASSSDRAAAPPG
jgi:membrane protein implicated in regulation of membrane protease activity